MASRLLRAVPAAVPVAAALVLSVVVVVPGLGCTPSGEYDGGNARDAGPDAEIVTLDDIGVPCIYDPATGENPTNTCPRGTECLMVSLDGAVNPAGMSLPSYEDHFSVDLPDGTTEGYCTLLGNAAAPPTCPQGAILKLVRSPAAAGGFAAFCVKPCTASAECGGSRVCDARFLDVAVNGVPAGVCVRPCFFDFPECALNGVTVATLGESQALTTAVDADSAFGDRVCERETGLCRQPASRGAGTKGSPCSTSADCVPGAACFQDELFPGDRDDGGVGFCATRCLVTPNGAAGCDVGSACQPGLLFGFQTDAITGGAMVIRDRSGAFDLRNGLCFAQCSEGLDTCTAFPDTACDAIDGRVMGFDTIGVSMCVPGEVSLQQQ